MHSNGEPRFVMLETVREFASHELTAAGGVASAREAMADFLMTVVGDATPRQLWPTPDALSRIFDVERDNLLEALTWLSSIGDRPRFLRLTTWLWTM